MITTLLHLLGQELDQQSKVLADLLFEKESIEKSRIYWFNHLRTAKNTLSASEIADWLQYGEKADRELKKLEEKDFVVETRILECRLMLLQLLHRQEILNEVLARRQREGQRALGRRHERAMAQYGAAQKAAREVQQHWL